MQQKKSQKQIKQVIVCSNLKGVKITELILKNHGFKFDFTQNLNPINTLDNKIIIKDDSKLTDQLKKCLNNQVSEQKYQLINLKDAQKSPASILALSGQLSTFGQNPSKQFVPDHVLDFIIGIGLANLILQYSINGFSRPLTLSLVNLVKYYGAFNVSAKQNGFLAEPLGKNVLDGGAPFYNLYNCQEGILAVGNLEPKFYNEMVKGMKLDSQKEAFLLKSQFNIQKWDEIRTILTAEFLKKKAFQWQKIMSRYDTCVTQVSLRPRFKPVSWPKINRLVQPKL